MKIDAITLHNYKCFKDTVHIDGLSSRLTSEKRVILFGGLNGAGKTTIFEAILLCLYGIKNQRLIPSKGAKHENYHSYIKSILNNRAKSKVRAEMYVELELSEVEMGGVPQSLRLKRSWAIIEGKDDTDEKFTITGEDGQSSFISEFTSDEDYDYFIESLIPYDVSQFFFFDGEKIQDFVKDEDAEFATSLEQVLGISHYRKLHEDLKKVRSQLVAENNKDAAVIVELKNVEAKIADCESKKLIAEESIAGLQEGIQDIRVHIEGIGAETRRITRIKAEKIDDYRSQRDKLIAEKAELEQQIFEAIKDDLPLVMMAQLCQEVIQQLEREQDLERQMAAKRALEPKINQITTKLFHEGLESVPMLTPKQKDFYIHKLRGILEDVLAERPINLQDIKLIHDLASSDIQQIKQRIDDSAEAIHQLSGPLRQFQEIESELKPSKEMRQANTDPEVERLYHERGQLDQQISDKEADILKLQTEMDKNKDEIESLNIQRTRLEDKAKTTAKKQHQIEYCRKLCDVIDDFSHEFRRQRAERLEGCTLVMWQHLARKQDLIKRIVVNPDRQFSIDLYDADDRLIDKTKLSAGEKELLAISLVSALSQIADRSLPIVIDTPLGRLDAEHRANIARYYFPNTSHQVILLSTDTEIVDNELSAIKPYISRCYTISYNKSKGTSSVISDRYFE